MKPIYFVPCALPDQVSPLKLMYSSQIETGKKKKGKERRREKGKLQQ